MLSPQKEVHYPNLRAEGYRLTSDTTENSFVKYNCVSLAAGGDFKNWWEPSTQNSKIVKKPGRFWIEGIPADGMIVDYVLLFKTLGYFECPNPKRELLWEKIAIFGYDDGSFSHVAYQLYFGWISKLGDWEDIKHKSLKALECENYGQPTIFMKRRCKLRGFLMRAFFNQVARLWPFQMSDRS